MLRLGDLPSLRRLKLASQEYYQLAMTYPRQLRHAYADDVAARDRMPGQVPPWVQPNIRRGTWTGQPRTESTWLVEFGEALFQGRLIGNRVLFMHLY